MEDLVSMKSLLSDVDFFKTKERLIQDFASGIEILKPDEYLGADGLPYCKKCNQPRWFMVDNDFAVRGRCKCQEEIRQKQKQAELQDKRMSEFNNRKKLSLLGERYSNLMFENATITKSNAIAYEKCRNYVANSEEILLNNIGLYIYGDNSSGKTYLTACLCNELVFKGHNCIYTNLALILNDIRNTFNNKNTNASELINRLNSYDFAFIDDLGKEFIGREYNPKVATWAEEKLFEILNTRYNAKKPTIFSSNYSISELMSVLGLDKAIVERINEMSTRAIKLEGDDFRQLARTEKSDIAKKLGI